MEKHIVKLTEDRKPLMAYLKQDMNLSSRKSRSLIKSGIQVNGKKAYGDTRLRDGDVLLFNEEKAKQDRIIPQRIELSILYEDEHILAVYKPPYMVVHPTKSHLDGTLANAVRYYFDQNNIFEPVRFFNRIDMNTSGIVLILKSSEVHSLMNRYSAYSVKKKYMAVVTGLFKDKKGRIELPLSNESDHLGRRYVTEEGSYAVTEYEVLEEYTDASLISVTIKTGRTHQIRVHMSSMGHPLLGDTLYGGDDTKIKRQALHAYELDFIHPINNKSIVIKSDLPSDMRMLIDELKGESLK